MPDIDYKTETIKLSKVLTVQEARIKELEMRLNTSTASYNECKGQVKAWKETVELMIESLMKYRNDGY